MKSSLCLTWSLLVGLFLSTPLAEAARATTLILGKSKPEPKIDTPPTAEEEVAVSASSDSQLANETASAGNVTKLTGVPQIDYIYDPNLPRELNGYNLTDYPFYNSVPEDIDFKCDGLHDGFYASIPHKCQVYHHCLFGTRYDFLCANYTAFDQKTFICHFASEVDCKNSPKYFNRNEALYKAQSTTTLPPAVPAVLTSGARRPQEGQGGRRRRPGNRRRKPVYDYYDDYEDSGEQDYYDEGPPGRKRKRPRPHNRESFDSSDEREEDEEKPAPPSGPNKSLYDRPRIAPKIRRPVPINERDKYDYGSDSRAILAKEPAVEKTRYENRESENRKANHRPDYYESTAQGNLRNKGSEDERSEREKEHNRDGYESERERDRDRERNREKNHDRDDYESDRERNREKNHDRDDYESDRERNRDKERDEYESERERERDRDRIRDRDRDVDRLYRDRRPPKKRRRPEDDDDYEYEEVRRYRNRNRPRYDEYDDDYDYDDRPYRPRNRDPDYRSREYDYDRDKGYRNRDSDYERPRNRDRNRDDKPVRNRETEGRQGNRDERPGRNKDDDRPHRTRDSDDEYYRGEEDRPARNKNKPRNEGKIDKNSRTRDRDSDRYYSEAESKKSIVREDYDDETDTGTEQKSHRSSNYDNKNRQSVEKNTRTQERERIPFEESLRPTERPFRTRESTERANRGRPTPETIPEDDRKPEEPEVKFTSGRTDRPQPRTRTGTVQKLKITPVESAEAEEEEKGTGPLKPEVKTQPEQSSSGVRKMGGTKRVHFPRPVTTTEGPSYDAPPRRPASVAPEPSLQQEELAKPTEPPERPRQEVAREREQPKLPETLPREEVTPSAAPEVITTPKKPEIASEAPKFKVPFEEQESEELAPQAPKYILPSSRRRPFLPSRGGNPNLPRGLLPVGSKALPMPRGFQKAEEGNGNEPKQATPPVQPKTQPPIEFKAKLTAAIGVQQPKLSSALYEHVDQGEQDSDSYYRHKEAGPDYREDYYQDFRPLVIKQGSAQDSYGSQTEKPAPVRINFQNAEEPKIVRAGSEVKDALRHRPIQITHPKTSLLNQQTGPQTFYSDNPKFKTTVTIPERFVQKPTASTLNYHTATHLPIYQPGLQSSFGVEQRGQNSPKDYLLAKGNENHKPLIIKFPPPEKENLDDTDEYDVSLNDALQPISTLHPRNAPTGIFLSQTHRVPHANGFNRRNHNSQHLYQEQVEYPERHQVLKRVRIEARSAPHQKKTLVQRAEASTLHQRYALPPGVLHGMKSSSPNSNFYAILS